MTCAQGVCKVFVTSINWKLEKDVCEVSIKMVPYLNAFARKYLAFR